jgi:hypothetical protein
MLGSAVAMAMATVLALGGCTETHHGPSSPTRGGGAGTTAAAPPIPETSPEDYRSMLDAATKPLNSALTAFEKNTAYKSLPQRMTTAEKAAAGALAQLRQVSPPTSVAGEHAALVTAVQRLDDDLADLSQNVDDRELCTASSVRTELGQGDGTAAVRDTAKALEAKEPTFKIGLRLPTAKKQASRRLANGSFVRSGGRGARGSLSIGNGGSDDAVITLARGKRPVYSVYVRKDKKYQVTGVRDGTYQVFFSTGDDWDPGTKSFSRNCEFEQFEDSLSFRTTYSATMIRWSKWTISLQPVAGGTARTSEVDPGDFPES